MNLMTGRRTKTGKGESSNENKLNTRKDKVK